MTENVLATAHPHERLIETLSSLIESLGYEVVHLECHTHRQKVLRLFIDFRESVPGRAIGIEDCVKVSRTLDEPLDQLTEVDAIFHGPYELEVSSPGVDRPLRTSRDFERFAGREVRIHVFRPLEATEISNEVYQSKNPRQKNFVGTLMGLREGKVRLGLGVLDGNKKPSKKKKASSQKLETTTGKQEEVTIPLPLISKANLEPKFEEFDESE